MIDQLKQQQSHFFKQVKQLNLYGGYESFFKASFLDVGY
jgi:hypothetical protein